ncbi:hypothetical protein CRG98_026206 [Punica granatum]|uniref:Uncharacterized protein n=1 Tax=Punica granatum TaxID=22663 RepID=A0A2I0JAY7_PUNGR|nr:hypothetical protein CRG98_026206 [Punica granatum]
MGKLQLSREMPPQSTISKVTKLRGLQDDGPRVISMEGSLSESGILAMASKAREGAFRGSCFFCGRSGHRASKKPPKVVISNSIDREFLDTEEQMAALAIAALRRAWGWSDDRVPPARTASCKFSKDHQLFPLLREKGCSSAPSQPIRCPVPCFLSSFDSSPVEF